MSTTPTKRKRARKACIPCHQRKRKCDAEYPCSMCTTYEYNCRYADHDESTRPASVTPHTSVSLSHAARGSQGAKTSSTKSLNAVPTVSAASSPHAGVFDERRSRYAGASAAMVFPHVLGTALGSNSIPKVRSVAYNFGIRPEETATVHEPLGNLISEDDLAFYSGLYFSTLAAVGDLLDSRIYTRRCRDYFNGSSDSTMVAFAAVAASVAALGSFLSPNKHPRESDLVQYAKAILDDPASMRAPRIDHIVAWGLRVFYLRATTRPNNAWIASCTVMHLCEALGLHEEENVLKIASAAGAALLGHDADRLRRIFWVCWAGHNLLCYEYDRSAVSFRAVTCQDFVPTEGSVADQFVQIAQIIPSPDSPFHLDDRSLPPRDEFFERLKALHRLHLTHPFLVVTKADVAFCFYRRIYQLKMGMPDEIVQLVINNGNAAVEAAEQLANQGRLLWNVIGSVFQYACILLAIDTPAAHKNIATAFKGLENLVKAADTVVTRDALSMARNLLSLNIAKKRKELSQLEAIEESYESFQLQQDPETGVVMPDTWWEMDWDQFFFEPYLSMPEGA